MINNSRSKLVSIVVRSFNEENHIEKLFLGLTKQTLQDFEIILVDSGSTDNTLKIAKKYPVKIISIDPDDFTFGYSLNRGCGETNGEYIIIASAHVHPVYVDWLEKMVELLEDDSIGLVYGKQRGNETSKYSERQIFKKWYPEEADLNQSHTFCNNANAAIKKDHWFEHRYDEKLTGLEDIAWAIHIHKKGLRIVYEPRAEVIHLHDETYEMIYNRYRREAITLKQIYKEQNFTFLDFVLLCTGNIISDWFHALEDNCFTDYFWEIIRFRISQFWGTYHGYNKSSTITSELKKKFYYPKKYRFNIKSKTDKLDDSSTIKY